MGPDIQVLEGVEHGNTERRERGGIISRRNNGETRTSEREQGCRSLRRGDRNSAFGHLRADVFAQLLRAAEQTRQPAGIEQHQRAAWLEARRKRARNFNQRGQRNRRSVQSGEHGYTALIAAVSITTRSACDQCEAPIAIGVCTPAKRRERS